MEFFILTLVNIGFLLLAFLYFRSRFHQALNAPALLRDVRDEVDVLVKELNVSAERNIAVLEERMAQMEELLAQADTKLVLLTRELERRERSQETYTRLKKPVIDHQEGSETLDGPAPGLLQATGPGGAVLAEEKPEPAPEGELFSGQPIEVSSPLGVPSPQEPSKPRPLKDRVLDLKAEHLDNQEISRRTGATLGEVELILSLHGRA